MGVLARGQESQLISAGSLFVICGNPPGPPRSLSAADNRGKQRTEEEMNARPCTCTIRVGGAVRLRHTHTMTHTPPRETPDEELLTIMESANPPPKGEESI